ncbi:ABC1 kinase family protein [Neomoorella thermoacetica]|uniref:ABC1 kinase family protein n=1 Tax=Neomoorella thermoacetica TaxID=1525 RepID=UPI0015D676CB|nr:AarF/UbiB family protein [Moorella thermoacetica]
MFTREARILLTRHYRYLQRYTEVATVLLRHGWQAYCETRPRRAPARRPLVTGREPGDPVYRHLRLAFEELGPVFIKLGQLLSTRPDLIPTEMAAEFSYLQDRVRPLAPDVIRQQVFRELGAAPEKAFSYFDYQPLAAASIAQVHKARLPGGQEVAVKVQRPQLDGVVVTDLAVLENLGRRFKGTVVGRICALEEILATFRRQIERELDFTVEALAMENFRRLYREFPQIVVPRVYWDYTTRGLLTMDYLAGKRLSDWYGKGTDCQRAALLIKALLAPFFQEGIFHGDPHPGNILFLPGGRLGLIDFGIVGRLDEDFRYQAARLILGLQERDLQAVMEVTLKLGKPMAAVDYQALYEDTAELVDRVTGMGKGDVNLAGLLLGMVELARRHSIRMPGTFFVLGRTIMEGESLARRLDPSLDLVQVSGPLAASYLRSRLRPNPTPGRTYHRAASTLQDLLELPRDISRSLDKLARGQLTTIFVHRGLETLYHRLDMVSARLSAALIVAALIGAGALILHAGAGPKTGGLSLLGLGVLGGALILGCLWALLLKVGQKE